MENLRDIYPLQKRKIAKKSLKTIIVVIVISFIVGVIVISQDGVRSALKNDEVGTFMAFGVLAWFLFVLIWGIIYQFMYFQSYEYESTDDYLSIKKGVIERREITVPYAQITDIYVEQDMSDRIFGLYDLHLSTPTAESLMTAHIDGLNELDCKDLKHYILEKVKLANS